MGACWMISSNSSVIVISSLIRCRCGPATSSGPPAPRPSPSGIQGHQFSFWGYQNFLSRLTVSLYGSFGDLTDGNNRVLGGATLTCRIFQDPLVKAKYSFFYIDYRSSSASLASLPSWSAPLYWDPQGFKNHSVGIVFEQNWAQKFKLAWETDMLFNQGTATPGFLGLVELDYLLTSNIVLRVVGSYSHSVDQGDRQNTSYR